MYDLRQKFNIQRLNRLKCSSNTIIDRYFLKKTVFLLNYFKFFSSSKFGSGSKFKCIWIHNTGLDCTLCTVYICGPVADMDHGRSVLLIYLFWPQKHTVMYTVGLVSQLLGFYSIPSYSIDFQTLNDHQSWARGNVTMLSGHKVVCNYHFSIFIVGKPSRH